MDRVASRGAKRVLTMSSIDFTVMFAVWMMFGILGISIQKELGLTDVQLAWLSAVAILNGSLWRLPAGILADRFGGRNLTLALIVATAVPTYLVSLANSYAGLLLLAFLVGFAGNLFSVGVAWNAAWFDRNRQGFALGLFGAGNVGASVTKLIGPPLIASTAGATFVLGIQGGWRLVPVIYAALLVGLAVLTLLVAPKRDRVPRSSRPLREMLAPLKRSRVWRFSLYYVAVFGAYVALSSWLPKYYVDNFGVSLATAGLLTATFIFPASLLRPLGGWLADRWGARRLMYSTFVVMLVTTGILMMPNGHIVVTHPTGQQTEHLAYTMGVTGFALVVFVLGCAMGVGKAAVFKHIPEYFPTNVGSVGGLVGMLGGIGGFALPPLFAQTKALSGFPSSTFFVLFILTAICLAWMHWTVYRMLHKTSPALARHVEDPADNDAAAGGVTPDRVLEEANR